MKSGAKLMKAVKENNIDEVKSLLAKKVTNLHEGFALKVAASYNHTEIVEILLKECTITLECKKAAYNAALCNGHSNIAVMLEAVITAEKIKKEHEQFLNRIEQAHTLNLLANHHYDNEIAIDKKKREKDKMQLKQLLDDNNLSSEDKIYARNIAKIKGNSEWVTIIDEHLGMNSPSLIFTPLRNITNQMKGLYIQIESEIPHVKSLGL